MKFNAKKTLNILAAIGGLARVLTAEKRTEFKVELAQLLEQLKPVLPAKSDGTPYTDDDLRAIGTRIDATLDEIDALTKPPIADGSEG